MDTGKKARKFNIIDFILIVFIAAAAAVLIYVMLGNSLFKKNEKITMLYDIEVDIIKNENIASVGQMPGCVFTDSVRGNEIGIVQSVRVEDAYQKIRIWRRA